MWATGAQPLRGLLQSTQTPGSRRTPGVVGGGWPQEVEGTNGGQCLLWHGCQILNQVMFLEKARVQIAGEKRWCFDGREKEIDVVAYTLEPYLLERAGQPPCRVASCDIV